MMHAGVGLDLQWGSGFVARDDGDRASDDVVAFLLSHAAHFHHLFVSWQPKSRARLDARDYFAAFDDLFGRLGTHYPVRALHHTALNLGAMEPYARGAILDLTCALVERYGFAWVNEDVGLWSLHGKPLPYPLPPYLTTAGLRAAIQNAREVQAALAVPLSVEFPGFSHGMSPVVGRMHAYDFFRVLADEADVQVTLDTGHLLSYQWMRGLRGEDLLSELERLPLGRCFEIHLSGCAVEEGAFHDRHDGILLPDQLELLQRLARLCPNARACTYEDPAVRTGGRVTEASAPSLAAFLEATAGP